MVVSARSASFRGVVESVRHDSVDNTMSSNKRGTLTTSTYDFASRLTTSIAGTKVTTFGFDANGTRRA